MTEEANKGSAEVVWDREGYLKEANRQRNDKSVYQETKVDVEKPFMKVIKSVFSNFRKRGDISDKSLDYFLLNFLN